MTTYALRQPPAFRAEDGSYTMDAEDGNVGIPDGEGFLPLFGLYRIVSFPRGDWWPPTITALTPPGAIAADATLSFDVVDLSHSAVSTRIWAAWAGATELVFDGSDFQVGYLDSTIDAIAEGKRYNLVRSGDGWADAFTVFLTASTTEGTAASGSFAYSAPAPPPVATDSESPQVSVISPPEGSALGITERVVLEVTDNLGLGRVILWADYDFLDAPELVHDGSNFSRAYLANSSRTAVAGGFRYSLLRKNGWPGPPTFTTSAPDLHGNEA